jgi:AAA+ superfamily predicted ATPase
MATSAASEAGDSLKIPASWLPVLDTLEARVRGFVDGSLDQLPALAPDEVPASLRELEEALPLDDVDLSILIIAAAAAMNVEVGTLLKKFGDESDSSGPTVDTVMMLTGLHPLSGEDRARFDEASILCVLGLIETGPSSRGLLRRTVVMPEPVVRFLLGHWEPDARVRRALVLPERDALPEDALPPVVIPERLPLVLRARTGTAAYDVVRRWTLATIGQEPTIFDASLLPIEPEAHQVALRVCARDASMLGTVLAIDYRSAPASIPVADTLSFFDFIGAPLVAIVDRRQAVGSWERTAIDLPIPTLAQREAWWRMLAPDADSSLAHTATHLEPDDIVTWGQGALPSLRMNAKKSSSRVQVIAPEVTLKDVIVEAHVRQQLEALADRVRYRSVVLDEWRMRPGGGRGRGVTALFAGESGTGKSMSAEALAGELGVPLFRVELASVVDKYIGETEKNLEEVFRSVENDDGVLLFDEADALFGKRSDVSDARDRYANIEVAYLLQRIEQFDGLAILTTNLRANLDEAFQRRLDAIVDFEEPDADARFTIWARALGPFEGSVADDDLRTLAAIDITGGSIRSAVVTAAYYAAAEQTKLTREHLLRGLQEEWRKAGRLSFPISDFDGWR